MIATKLIEKTPDPCNAKKHYQSFIRKKNIIIKNNYFSTKNPNIADIKSITTEHPKTLHKLSKTIKQTEKVSSNSSLYSDTKKIEIFLNEQK